ncbi:MAG: DUF1704 domain-containing protein [Gemmatimonadetes bacterium]|nr:DUF1704 domain-containing protein [Gemmatimonadota bacterium]
MGSAFVDELPARDAPETPPGERMVAVARAARAHLADGASFRAVLPGDGKLYLDRMLPFLAAYRSPPGHSDAGASSLADALASHLIGPGEEDLQEGLDAIVVEVVATGRAMLGDFLLVELWTEPEDEGEDGIESHVDERPRPAVVRVVAEGPVAPPEAEALKDALEALRLCPENGGDLGVPPHLDEVVLELRERVSPPGLAPLAAGETCVRIGIEVSPFFRRASTGKPYPRVLSALRRELGRAVEQAVFGFAHERTSLDVAHPTALARRVVDRPTRHVDARLGEIYGAFDTLLQVTPTNADEAWECFRDGGFERAPRLCYRPLPFDPEETKRRLFHVPIEHVEDPLLNHLFREKQEELDREISLVRSLATRAFRWAAYQLHGVVDDALLALAHGILERLPPRGATEEEEPAAGYVDAPAFARLALREIDHYRALLPDFEGSVEIRDDLASGLMVSKGVLLVSSSLRMPRRRVEALVQHEVGTHVVTHANGARQPLRLFAAGLAGYEALQEGLAVLAEHLAGGLTRQRVRVLAARVVAVHAMIEGASFVDTWRLLAREHGFAPRTAFVVTLRVHRGGGLTKDALYLRGLRDLLAYLGDRGSLDPLLVGKVGLDHAEAVQELVLRGILRLPGVKPRYLTGDDAAARLHACRGADVLALVDDLAA